MQLSKLKKEFLFLPVGGSGEIGLNLNLYHYDGKWIMVDCGASFANARIMPGVDLIVPDISFFTENKIEIEAMIITHAHEDHVGAIGHIWPQIKCPIYCTPFTAHFIKTKLSEFELCDDVKIKVVTDKVTRMKIGPFEIEMIGMSHSIPEMRSLYIKTPVGSVLHTGDWKIDRKPIFNDFTNEKRLGEISQEGVTAMVCDSTNVFSEGWSGSESDAEEGLYEAIKPLKQLVVVTTFASNVSRVKSIIEVARKCGRNVALSGSSIHRIISIAGKSKYINDEFMDIKDITDKNRNNTLVIATGCQGEPLATVAKLSGGTHPFLKIKKGDTIVFSSKIIPGNEENISDTMNRFVDLGVNIIHEKSAKIHVSGHPHRDELKHLYGIVKPKFSIPVHGQAMHIEEHCKFAVSECGVGKSVSVRNGDIVSINHDNGAKKIHQLTMDYLGVDGFCLHSPGGEVMRSRRRMKNGVILCSFVLNGKGGIVCQPTILSPGALDSKLDAKFITSLEKVVSDTLKKKISSLDGSGDKLSKPKAMNDVSAVIKQAIKQYVARNLNIKPYIEVVFNVV